MGWYAKANLRVNDRLLVGDRRMMTAKLKFTSTRVASEVSVKGPFKYLISPFSGLFDTPPHFLTLFGGFFTKDI